MWCVSLVLVLIAATSALRQGYEGLEPSFNMRNRQAFNDLISLYNTPAMGPQNHFNSFQNVRRKCNGFNGQMRCETTVNGIPASNHYDMGTNSFNTNTYQRQPWNNDYNNNRRINNDNVIAAYGVNRNNFDDEYNDSNRRYPTYDVRNTETYGVSGQTAYYDVYNNDKGIYGNNQNTAEGNETNNTEATQPDEEPVINNYNVTNNNTYYNNDRRYNENRENTAKGNQNLEPEQPDNNELVKSNDDVDTNSKREPSKQVVDIEAKTNENVPVSGKNYSVSKKSYVDRNSTNLELAENLVSPAKEATNRNMTYYEDKTVNDASANEFTPSSAYGTPTGLNAKTYRTYNNISVDTTVKLPNETMPWEPVNNTDESENTTTISDLSKITSLTNTTKKSSSTTNIKDESKESEVNGTTNQKNTDERNNLNVTSENIADEIQANPKNNNKSSMNTVILAAVGSGIILLLVCVGIGVLIIIKRKNKNEAVHAYQNEALDDDYTPGASVYTSHIYESVSEFGDPVTRPAVSNSTFATVKNISQRQQCTLPDQQTERIGVSGQYYNTPYVLYSAAYDHK